ncbi:MAG: carbohydrate ABC transporter permease, partial [Nostocoides sp.]
MRTRRSPATTVLLYAVLIVALVIVMAPLVWMMLGSLKTDSELRQVPPTFLPMHASLANFSTLFSKLSFSTYFFNSTVVAVVVTAANLAFCSMLGYALAMLEFRGKRVLFAIVMGTLMIPGVVTFIPLFVLVANMGLVNTLPGLFLPFLVAPFGVFLMRQFMQSLPRDLMDAGRVDGAGELSIFARIILPLCGPAMATL